MRTLQRSSADTLDCLIRLMAVTKVSIALPYSAKTQENILITRKSDDILTYKRTSQYEKLVFNSVVPALASDTAREMALEEMALFLFIISSNSASLSGVREDSMSLQNKDKPSL